MLFYTSNDDNVLMNILNQQTLLNVISKGNIGTNDIAVTIPLVYKVSDLQKPLFVKTDDNLYVIHGNYPYLNTDEKFINNVIHWVRYKILDDWFADEMKPLLSYFDIDENGKVHWVSKAKFNEDAYLYESYDIIKKKVRFIEEEILSKKLIKHILEKFINHNNINWYDVKRFNNKLGRVFNSYLRKKFDEKLV